MNNLKSACLIAKDFQTAPELLEKLGECSNPEIRKYVAENPNTPTDTLFKLAVDFPKEFLNNPILPLLLLEYPNLVQILPINTLVSLLEVEEVPTSFLEWAAEQYQSCEFFKYNQFLAMAVVMNVNTPSHVLKKLLNCWDVEIAEAAALHVNLAGEISEGWNEMALAAMKTTTRRFDKSVYLLWEMGLIPETLIPFLDEYTQFKITRNQNIQMHRIELINRNSLPMRQSIDRRYNQHSSSVPTAKKSEPKQVTIEKLLQRDNRKVREVAANYAQIQVQKLPPLVKDKNEDVRISVINNPKASTSLLKRFVNQEKIILPVKIASLKNLIYRNPDKAAEYLKDIFNFESDSYSRFLFFLTSFAPSELLDKSDRSPYWLERYAIAKNPNTPNYTRERLTQDANRIVRATAKNYLSPR